MRLAVSMMSGLNMDLRLAAKIYGKGRHATGLLGIFLAGLCIGAVSCYSVLHFIDHKRLRLRPVFADIAAGINSGRHDEDRAPLECWGDSLTKGVDASAGHDFPSLIANVFHVPTSNFGVAGETSTQIRQRMLARQTSGTSESVVIWAGRNDDLGDPDTTLRNVAQMIGSLAPASRYLVLGLTNSDTRRERRGGDRYAMIEALNAAFKRIYGPHFVAIREFLIAHADMNDPADVEAVEDDVVPPSLRSDGLHLDDEGLAIVAYAVVLAIREGRGS